MSAIDTDTPASPEPEVPAPAPQKKEIKTRRPHQTVCDEPGVKDKFCSGHLKHYMIGPPELDARVPKGHVLFRCQRCGQLYEGEPILHLR